MTIRGVCGDLAGMSVFSANSVSIQLPNSVSIQNEVEQKPVTSAGGAWVSSDVASVSSESGRLSSWACENLLQVYCTMLQAALSKETNRTSTYL
jgi:hypothetical protein